MIKNYNEVLYNNRRIETERLFLRPMQLSDAEDMFEYASDEETLSTLMWEGVKTLDEAKAAIYDWHLASPHGKWAITLKDGGKLIGGVDVGLNHAHDKGSFGYVINRQFWGKGYMTEAFAAIVDLCFMRLELNRVEARFYVGNEGSGRVMEKVGMKHEGVLIASEKIKGKFKDVVYYGLTREQYLQSK